MVFLQATVTVERRHRPVVNGIEM